MSQRANESSQPVCVWVCVCVLFFMMNSHRCILFNKWICDSDRCFLVRSFVRFWMLCALLMCSYKSLVFMVCIWNAANVIMAGVVPLRESLFELKLSWLALTYENVCLCLYIYICILMAPSRLINIKIKDYMDMECALYYPYSSTLYCISLLLCCASLKWGKEEEGEG